MRANHNVVRVLVSAYLLWGGQAFLLSNQRTSSPPTTSQERHRFLPPLFLPASRHVLKSRQQNTEALQEEPSESEWPLWWTFPDNASLEDECRVMKQLLNDEPDEDLVDLVEYQLAKNSAKSQVLQVRVAAVGPSGVIVRAHVQQQQVGVEMMELALPFAAKKPATSAKGIRMAVFDLIDTAVFGADDDKESESDTKVKEENKSIEDSEAKKSEMAFTAVAKEETKDSSSAAKKDKVTTDVAEGDMFFVQDAGVPLSVEEKEAGAPPVEEKEVVSPALEVPKDNSVVEVPVTVEADVEDDPTDNNKEDKESSRKKFEEDIVAQARQQPKTPSEEEKLSAKYAAIENLSERAYQILLDLAMLENPSS